MSQGRSKRYRGVERVLKEFQVVSGHYSGLQGVSCGVRVGIILMVTMAIKGVSGACF